jgi:hypothetical protein
MLATLRPSTWTEASEWAKLMVLWGFRGQSDASWPLESTLTRLAQQCRCHNNRLNHREYWMSRQFERRAFDYLNSQPLPTTKLDWLALMQHHGSPTRLLDFSHSFYVAAFFAMETASDDAAVWCINHDMLGNRIAAHMEVETHQENLDHRNTRHISFLEKFLSLQGPPAQATNLVVPVEPEKLHQRLTIQQGFFVAPTDLLASFESNLSSTLGLGPTPKLTTPDIQWTDFEPKRWDYGVVRMILPRSMHRNALQDLHSMNITAATLFPGLDGFARSMRIHVRNSGY